MILIEPVGIETMQQMNSQTQLTILIEPVGIETHDYVAYYQSLYDFNRTSWN